MARLSDVPIALRSAGLWTMTKRVWQQVHEDNLAAWGAALAYSWLFAVFPFLIFMMSLMPYLPANTRAAAEKEMEEYISYLPTDAKVAVWQNVSDILSKRRTSLLSIGLVLAIWGASGGMNMTISALDKCYELDQGRPFYRQRPIAIGLTVIAATLMIVLLVLLPIGTLALHWVEKQGAAYLSVPLPLLWTWKILRYPLALLMMLSVVNVIYQFGPSIRQRFTFLTPGGVFCVLVWIGLAVVFRIYVEKFGKFNETYGTVGGVAVLLLFFYIDAVVLLIGAEVNSEIDFEVLGVKRGERDFRTARPEGARMRLARQGFEVKESETGVAATPPQV